MGNNKSSVADKIVGAVSDVALSFLFERVLNYVVLPMAMQLLTSSAGLVPHSFPVVPFGTKVGVGRYLAASLAVMIASLATFRLLLAVAAVVVATVAVAWYVWKLQEEIARLRTANAGLLRELADAHEIRDALIAESVGLSHDLADAHATSDALAADRGSLMKYLRREVKT